MTAFFSKILVFFKKIRHLTPKSSFFLTQLAASNMTLKEETNLQTNILTLVLNRIVDFEKNDQKTKKTPFLAFFRLFRALFRQKSAILKQENEFMVK